MNNVIGGKALLDINDILLKLDIIDGMKVADLGCGGSGYFVFSVANLVGDNGKVYAVDILRSALENIENRAKQEDYSNVKTVWSNLEIFGATKIESASVDIVLVVNILYLSTRRADILREGLRLLKKGGRMVVIDWKNSSLPIGPGAEDRVKPEILKDVSKRLGMELNNEFLAGEYHFGLIFTKI